MGSHDDQKATTDELPSSPDGTAFFPAMEKAPAPEVLYQMLVEHIPAMVYLSAPDDPGDVYYVSPQVRDQLGYEPEEWLSQRHFWKTRLHPDDRDQILEIDRQSGQTGQVFNMQYRMYHREGHLVWVQDQGILVHGSDGSPIYWLGFTFDISNEKQIEAALREAEERYRALVEQIPAVIFTVSADQIHHPVYLSPQAEEMFGYSREEWAADPEFWLKIIHPDDLEEALREVRETDSSGDTFSFEYRMIARDGSIVWVQNESSPIYNADGEPAFWQGVLVDITERKLAEQALREAETRYRTLVEQIPVATYIEPHFGQGVPSYISPQIEDVLGYSLDYWQEHPDVWVRSIHPDDYDMWAEAVERTNRTGEQFDLEHRVIAADGSIVWIRSTCQLVDGEDGLQFWQGTVQDITENILAEQRLNESEQRYRSLFDNNPDPVYSFNLEGTLESANNALCELSGYALNELLGTSFEQFIVPEDIARVSRHFERAAMGEPQDYDCLALRKDGSAVEIHVTNLPIKVGGEIVGVYGVAKDISERKNLERQLKHMAFHDPLTRLPNRLLFMDRLQQALAAIPRRSTSIAVLFVDIDNFKALNDTLGHDAGDQALRHIAEMLQSCIRAGDTASRLGGDEFTILLTDIQGLDDAIDVANRILQRFEQPIQIQGEMVLRTASIGIVHCTSPDVDPEALIRRGDRAMYRAKALGKSRYEIYESPDCSVATPE